MDREKEKAIARDRKVDGTRLSHQTKSLPATVLSSAVALGHSWHYLHPVASLILALGLSDDEADPADRAAVVA